MYLLRALAADTAFREGCKTGRRMHAHMVFLRGKERASWSHLILFSVHR